MGRRLAFALAAALSLLGALPAGAVDRQDDIARTAAAVERMAPSYGLDPVLVRAVIIAESGFDPRAVSPKNAQGLMQLMPETAARFGVADTFDPGQNLRGGMSYLRWLLDRYGGNLSLTLAAYNAGEGAVDQYRGIPPFPETQAYVARVRQLYSDHAPLSAVSFNRPRYLALPPARREVPIPGTSMTVEHTRAGVLIYRGPGAS